MSILGIRFLAKAEWAGPSLLPPHFIYLKIQTQKINEYLTRFPHSVEAGVCSMAYVTSQAQKDEECGFGV